MKTDLEPNPCSIAGTPYGAVGAARPVQGQGRGDACHSIDA